MFRDRDYSYEVIAPEGFQEENTLTAFARGDLSSVSFPSGTREGEMCLCWVCLFGGNPTGSKVERIRSCKTVANYVKFAAEEQDLTYKDYLNSLLEDPSGMPVGFGFITLFQQNSRVDPVQLQRAASQAAQLKTPEHTVSVRMLDRSTWANAMNWYNQYYDQDSADSWKVFGQVWP